MEISSKSIRYHHKGLLRMSTFLNQIITTSACLFATLLSNPALFRKLPTKPPQIRQESNSAGDQAPPQSHQESSREVTTRPTRKAMENQSVEEEVTPKRLPMALEDITLQDVSIKHRPARPIFDGRNAGAAFVNARSQ